MSETVSSATILDLLSELVSIPSVSKKEGAVADRIVAVCRAWGLYAERRGRNVLARRGRGRPTLLLNSHIDTVPPVEGWTMDPWSPRVADGRLYGLGANDAKAAVASMLEAFHTASLPASGTLLLAATCDEETGGDGLEKLAPELDFDEAIVGEPNDFAVAVAQKGLVKLRLTARGRAGHAARPHLADNAISRASRDALAVEALRFPFEDPFLGPPTAAVTEIHGGIQSNVIPGSCRSIVDARTIPEFGNDAMIAAIRGAVSAEVEVLSARLHPVAGNADSRVVRAALEASGRERMTGFSGMSDLAHLSGKPAIVFGPGTPDQSHAADESIALESLAAAPATYRRTIERFFA